MRRSMLRFQQFLVCLLACSMFVASGALAQEPSLEQRLERLSARIESDRQAFHIPGISLAIIKDDRIILASGFGEANVETHEPATEHTRYAVGSTTKAFAAVLIGMLADDGRMDWDDPVRKYLPEYRLSDAEANERVAIRDLLCHRIGLASLDLLWFGNVLSREEILATSYNAKLLYPFREKWNYNNVSFLAAGQASAVAGGKTWDALIAERIFQPLGMKTANTTYAAAQADPMMARGYKWDKDKSQLQHQPMRNLDSIAPAGSINASVIDMAQWIRFQLGRGRFEGKMLLTAKRHEETWTPQIDVNAGAKYALGWLVAEWNGKRIITHDGGIDGFTAHVTLLPEENLGFVLLMNLFGAPLAGTATHIVLDGLLGEWQPDAGSAQTTTEASEDFADYLGVYIGNFGHFDGAEFKVLMHNGHLAVDVPGQMIFQLNPPNEEGKRTFAITDTIAVRFNQDSDGKVYSMSLFQGGAFEFPRMDATYPLEIDLEHAAKCVGTYHSESMNSDIRVLIQNNRLAVDVPGQMRFELFPPDEEGQMLFRFSEGTPNLIRVQFNTNETGEVVSMHMHQPGFEETMRRIKDPKADLPTVDQIIEQMLNAIGSPSLASLHSLRTVGSVDLVHQGVRGRFEIISDEQGRVRSELNLGRLGHVRGAFDGSRGWSDNPFTGFEEADSDTIAQMQLENPWSLMGDWRKIYESVIVLSRERSPDGDVYVLQLTPAKGRPRTVHVNAETWLPKKFIAATESAVGQSVEVTHSLGDYRAINGVKFPFRVEISNQFTGVTILQTELGEPNIATDAQTFMLEEAR